MGSINHPVVCPPPSSQMQTQALRATFCHVLAPNCGTVPVCMSQPKNWTFILGNLRNTGLVTSYTIQTCRPAALFSVFYGERTKRTAVGPNIDCIQLAVLSHPYKLIKLLTFMFNVCPKRSLWDWRQWGQGALHQWMTIVMLHALICMYHCVGRY